MQSYEGNVLLIVNIPSKGGFSLQIKELQKLYEQYQNRGFYVLGFPSNQFMNQKPLYNEDIPDHFQEKYDVSFPIFKKTDVRGEDINPLFAHLMRETKGIGSNAIKWHFTKFLVGREGTVLYRYSPRTLQEKNEADIKEALK